MPKITKRSVDVAKLLKTGKEAIANNSLGKNANVPYSPLKRAGDRQLMVTKDSDKFYAKKNLDKKIEEIRTTLALDLVPNSRQEGVSPKEAAIYDKKIEEMTAQMNALKAKRKGLK